MTCRSGFIVGLVVCVTLSATADEPADIDLGAPSGKKADKGSLATAEEYRSRALELIKKGDVRKATADLTAAIRLEPKNAVLYAERGQLFASAGDQKRALADFDLAVRFDPKLAMPYAARADLWRRKGEYARAKADYSEALRVEPKNAVVSCNLAWLLSTCPLNNLRDGRRALQLATQACEQMEWTEPESLDTLAAANAEVGDFEQAQIWQGKAMRIAEERQHELKGAKERLALYKQEKPYREPWKN